MVNSKNALNAEISVIENRVAIGGAVDIWINTTDWKEPDWVQNESEALKLAHLIKAAPKMLEALELCADYIKDLHSENFEDLDAGIRYDYQLRKAHDTLITAIKKAKGE